MHYVDTVTLPQCEELSNPRRGIVIFCELAQSNAAFLDRIQAANRSDELHKLWAEMQGTAFLSYKLDPDTVNSSNLAGLSLDEQKHFLIEVLDKNMLYVPLSEIDDESFGIQDREKALNRQFHSQR